MTAHPTADWTAQQLRDAFPYDRLPRYLEAGVKHTLDAIYSELTTPEMRAEL